MKRAIVIAGVIVALIIGGCTQKVEAFKITAAPLKASTEDALAVIEELTQPVYGGRLAGTPENEKAAEYIAQQFENIGLQPIATFGGYRQPFVMPVAIPKGEPRLQVVGEEGEVIKNYQLLEDFMPQINLGGTLKGEGEGEIVGITQISELLNHPKDYEGKVAVVSYADLGRSVYSLRREFQEQLGAFEGIEGLLIGMPTRSGEQDHPYAFAVSPATLDLTKQDPKAPVHMVCTPEVMSELEHYGETPEKEKVRLALSYDYKQVTPSNVVGMIPGSDRDNPQYLIISAHFDHVGDNQNGTYNPGALDNSSGTGAMLALAKAIANNPIPPTKTIIFAAFNGEEEGLYGSKYFVAHTPSGMTPDNTVCINLDMVGSSHMQLLNLYSTKITGKVNQELLALAKKQGLTVEHDTGNGSDHYYFNQAGYESVTLINPDLGSGYHTPADTLEDVSPKALEQVLSLMTTYIEQAAYATGM